MACPVLKLRMILPSLLAVLLLAGSPLLHKLHLAGCSCSGQKYVGSLGVRAVNYFNFGVAKRGVKRNTSSAATRLPPVHDSKHCPVCRMYAALYAGFNLPQVLLPELSEIVLVCAAQCPESVSCIPRYYLFTSRSPPVL